MAYWYKALKSLHESTVLQNHGNPNLEGIIYIIFIRKLSLNLGHYMCFQEDIWLVELPKGG